MHPFYRLQDLSRLVALEEIEHLRRTGQLLIDLRSATDYKKFHIEGFINLPANQMQYWLHTLDKNRPLYFLCQHGHTAYQVAHYLFQSGYQAYAFNGGIQLYQTLLNTSQHYF